MAVESYDLVTIMGDFITADLLVWRRYRMRAPGIVERMLDDNPMMARVHAQGPYLPVGMQVRIPIDPDILRKAPKPLKPSSIWSANPNL